jgi:ATP/maltotriose-dependent transcriptional regulator MalT
VGAELLGAAREAFARGMRWTFAINAAVAAGLAIVAALLLRKLGTSMPSGGEPGR